MADNLVVTAGTGTNVASDEVTYSGDTAKLGIVRLVHVDGAEGAKSVKELVRLEDAAHTTGDPGIPTLTVRQDTAAALSDTDADYQPLITDGSGRLHVNVGASALPTGAATSAKQDTIIGHLDGVEGLLTTIDADTSNLSTKIDTIAGAVAGTEMQVDILTMPTVTVTATNLDVQSGGADLATSAQGAAIQTAVETIDNAVSGAGFNITQLGGVAVSIGTGVRDAGTQRVTIATNDSVPVTFTGSTDVATQTTLASLLTSSQLLDDVVATLGTTTYTETSTKGNIIGAVRRDANTTLVDTTNEVAPLQVNATGELKVAQIQALPAGTNNIGDVDILSITAAAATNKVDVGLVNGEAVDVGAGTEAAAIRVTLPTNGTGVVGLNAGTNNIGDVDVLTVNGVAPAFGTGTRGATVQRVTIATDDIVPASQSGTWTVQPGNTPNSTAWLTSSRPAISGGLTKFHLVGAATDNATNIKASAGQVYSITAFNVSASPRYLKFHNTAGTPTAGSGVTDTFLIPGNTAGAGLVLNIDNGIAFSTGIGISIVTGIADNNTTAIGASEVVLNIYYA